MRNACTIREYHMDRRRIALLRFWLEAYEGLATLTTVHSATGHVKIAIAPGCEPDFDSFLEGIRHTIHVRPIAAEC